VRTLAAVDGNAGLVRIDHHSKSRYGLTGNCERYVKVLNRFSD
jgi:hypothetical protein